MSQKIKKAIKDKIVKPELNKRREETNGKILKTYDLPKKKEDLDKYSLTHADIEVTDSSTGAKRTVRGVPIVDNPSTGGIDGRHLQKGDNVIIEFIDGNPLFPKIVGRTFEDRKQKEQELETDVGVNMPDAFGFFG